MSIPRLPLFGGDYAQTSNDSCPMRAQLIQLLGKTQNQMIDFKLTFALMNCELCSESKPLHSMITAQGWIWVCTYCDPRFFRASPGTPRKPRVFYQLAKLFGTWVRPQAIRVRSASADPPSGIDPGVGVALGDSRLSAPRPHSRAQSRGSKLFYPKHTFTHKVAKL